MVVVVVSEVETVLSRPKSKAGRVQRVCLEALLAHEARGELPTNGRFIFYELEGLGHVVKPGPDRKRRTRGWPAGTQDLIDALSELRKRGIVPWDWIADETRTVDRWRYAATVAEFVAASAQHARIDPWAGVPAPLIVIESRSLGGVLRDLAAEYLCPLAPTNGQVGGFLHTDVAPLLVGNDRAVLYLGDRDHQGDQIEANTRRVLEREADRAIEWRRVAITAEQIAERGLEPIWKTDDRYVPPKSHEAWETEALGQATVVSLVRRALDSLLPEPLEDVQEREAAQREDVQTFLAKWNGDMP